jgi:Fe-S cluster assembly protein SufD
MAGANLYLDNYKGLEAALPGQNLPWLCALRKAAFEQFATSGFPSPREEDWRYTNVTAIEKKQFAPVLGFASAHPNLQTIDKDWLNNQQIKDAWVIVLVDGHFAAELSNLSGLPDDLKVMGMAQALQGLSDWLEPYLGRAVQPSEHGFVAFNGAWFSDGVFVHVPTKQVLAKPIQILNIVTQPDVAVAVRNVVVSDCSTETTLIETFAAVTDAAYLSTSVTEVFLGKNAALTHYKLQTEADNAYHFGGTYVKQAASARFTHHNFAFGGFLARTDIHADLAQAAECELYGLYLGINRQNLDNHTRINHLKPHGISRELYKGVLDDRARGVFQGRVIVAEDAQKTDSQMSNRNLLLSADAEADTKPQLEIYADDVKCGHGVTVGQLDEKSVFYLQSRCVDEETARNMLTFAFANEMVEKVKIKDLHDQVLAQVLKRFPQEGIEKDWL